MTPAQSERTVNVGHMPNGAAHGSVSHSTASSQSDVPTLIPLTPDYSDQQHGIYLRYLKAAITGPQKASIKNIALTGSYGIGKSSVLEKLAEAFGGSCVRLSLSTLGDESEACPDDAVVGAPVSITNRIQKEIVKQLLYREKPWKVRDSRFRRIGRFGFWPQLPVSALAAAMLLPIIYVIHGADRIVHFAGTTIGPRAAAYVGIFAFLVVAISSLRYIAAQSRIQFEKLGAGPATVTLSAKADSYFDEYLDEIVYFFEKTKCSLAIFEDIDRFDEPHIFETLRELNTILNNSKQLKHQVRFVYAIKDSIFERLEASQQPQEELGSRYGRDETSPRANRTKFFDLVIPIVPFITHRNARDLMSDIMDGHSNVSKELIDLAAKHVTDMRMIKNIRNEFFIFREKLDVQHTRLPGLDDDALFALIVYKNVHLSDFEKIKEGTSDLDELYRASRRLVESNLRRLRTDAATLKRQLKQVASVEKRSGRLGDRVEEYVRRVIRHMVPAQAVPIQYTFLGRVISPEELRTAQFWRNFLDPDSQPNLDVVSNYQPRNLTFSRADLAVALGEEFSEQHWTDADERELNDDLEANAADQSFLRTADMSELVRRPRFELIVDDEPMSFKAIAEQTLRTLLATELIANGYINRNFTLYVSQYYGVHVSLDAMNYLVHHVYTNDPGTTFPLTPNDVESVIREAGSTVLNDRSMYNISIVDYLVSQTKYPVGGFIDNLVQWGEDERIFLSAYISDGKHARKLFRLLSKSWPRVFVAVDELDVEVDDITRVSLLDGALEGAAALTKYETNRKIADFIADHYSEMGALTKPRDDKAAASAVRTLSRFGVVLPSLRHLDLRVKRDVIRRHMYLLIPANLTDALGGVEIYALDRILNTDTDVYDYILNDLSTYKSMVEATPSTQHTVASNVEFIRVLQDVQAKSPAVADYVARHASPECCVDVLTEAAEDLWPVVVDARRVTISFANVSVYTSIFGIDEHLAPALAAAGAIETSTDDDQAQRRAWATAVVNAYDSIRDPGTRVRLVVSLDLAEPLTVSGIQRQDGPLYGFLLEDHLLADTSDVYAAVSSVGASARETYIAKSPEFINYMSPDLFQPDHVPALLSSDHVRDDVKTKLATFLAAMGPRLQPESANSIANCAVRQDIKMPIESLLAVAQAGAKPAAVVRLIEPSLGVVTNEQLSSVLNALGEPYSGLTQCTGGSTVIPTTEKTKELLQALKRGKFVTRFNTLKLGGGTKVYLAANS